jgi:hypothetical protein
VRRKREPQLLKILSYLNKRIKNRIISFTPFNDNDFPNFVSSKTVIPAWFKNIPKYGDGHNTKDASEYNKTVKMCTPFIEAMTSGYMVTTSHDMIVAKNDMGPYISWPNGGELLEVRKLESLVPCPAGYYSVEFVWNLPVAFKIPKNHSFLITQPFNRYDLPFLTMTGIVDGPFLMYGNGKIPFFVKKDFEGVIPQGTPIMQIIPFKHDNWMSKRDDSLKSESETTLAKSTALLEGWYKKNFWIKKNYQ